MSLSRVLTSSLAVVSLLGCKPEDSQEQPAGPIAVEEAAASFARQICASLFSCECAGVSNFASEDDCVDQLSAEYQTRIDELLAGGASWNADCAGQAIAAWSSWQCLGPNQASAESPYDARVCPVVKGTLTPGSECIPSAIGDECAAGSVCVSGVCVTTTVPVPLGSTCEYDWQELPCEADSYCGVDLNTSERICKPFPVAGDFCTLEEGWYCGPGWLGLMCNYDAMACEPAPDVGEPCFQGSLCGPGTYCDGGKDFTCQERFELGDSCGADAVCPVDASCVNNVCTADPPAACGLANFDF